MAQHQTTPASGSQRPYMGPSDSWHVDLDEEWELQLWTREFACTETELRAAVAAVGPVAGRVRWHLGRV